MLRAASLTTAAITGGTIAGVTGVPIVLANSGTLSSAPADTSEDIVGTVTIPAGRLRANDAILVRAVFTATNNANNKTFRVRYSGIGGTVIAGGTARSSVPGSEYNVMFWNANSTGAQQIGFAYEMTTAGLLVATTMPALSVDTTASTTIVFTAQKATAGDTASLAAYTVWILAA